MSLTLYNTEQRQKQPFSPIEKGHVKMYTCGPTVYHYAHIGNFRTYVFEDLLRRTLKYFGHQVTQVMNLTDVDDKTIKGAIREKVSLNTFTEPYKKAFFEDLKTLNIEPVEHYPQATDYIPQMIEMIEALLKTGVAYVGKDGSVYFSIAKFPRYGCLSHLHLDELQAGASDRVLHDEYEKESIADFVLWKAYEADRDGQIFWESPFGKGRPGWHLECSAMAMHLLGETIDIHVGGIDNMFPHHENEIAQSEACSGKRFVNLWMHSEHLIVDGKKMSKSLGNFFTLRDLLNKGYTGPVVRYMLLHTHYKSQLNFTFQGLESIKATFHRLESFVIRLKEAQTSQTPLLNPLIAKADRAFKEALADDLNISLALGHLFDFIRDVNAEMDKGIVGKEDAHAVLELLKRFDQVLGVISFDTEIQIPADLSAMLDQRIQARKDKNFKLADTLRDQIHARGYVIEDTPHGARLKKV